MDMSRLITGWVLVLIGIVLIFVPFFVENRVSFISWIYGIPVLIMGLFIFFNKNENEIEGIKNSYTFKSGKFKSEKIKGGK